jgi:hypothetical protein
MPGNFTYYVEPILESPQLAAGRRGKLRYVFAIVSETRLSVVW